MDRKYDEAERLDKASPIAVAKRRAILREAARNRIPQSEKGSAEKL